MWKLVLKTMTPPLSKASAFLIPQNNLQQQLRTTFIFKRQVEPRSNKRGMPPKKLRTRNYIYELVKDTNTEKQSNMEVILTSYVDGLGNVGDRISVKPNYAYENLLLPGLAMYVTPENSEKYKDVEVKEEKHYSSARALRTMQVLSKITLSVIMNKDSPWTIQPWHIRTAFRKASFIVPQEAIEIPEKPIKGPDMNIEGKIFYVTVTINKTERVPVKCQIHHWSTDIKERLPYVEGFWKEQAEFLFPEDADRETDLDK